MSPAVLRPLSAGEILDGAFTIYRRQFVPLVALAVLMQIPSLAAQVFLPKFGTLLALPFGIVLSAALVYLASEAYLDRPLRIGAGLRVGLGKLLPMLVSSIGYGVILGIGFLLLVVPGVIFAIRFFLWQPVVVLENRAWPFERAGQLARNSWGKILSLMLLTFLITTLPMLSLGVGTEMLHALPLPDASAAAPAESSRWITVATVAFATLTAPFSAAVITLLYYDQRVRKEGLGVEMQAAALGSAPHP